MIERLKLPPKVVSVMIATTGGTFATLVEAYRLLF